MKITPEQIDDEWDVNEMNLEDGMLKKIRFVDKKN